MIECLPQTAATSLLQVVLGRSPQSYAEWIRKPGQWGGAIELAILAEHFRTELAAFDCQTQRVDIYGQGQNFAQRVLLVYDGLHYDPMAKVLFDGAPEELDVTVFETGDEAAMAQARALVGEAHSKRLFTDRANFAIRCLVCQLGLKGEKDAVEHAKSTGHQNFSEYK